MGEVDRARADQAAPFVFSVELCADCRRSTLPQRKRPGIVKDATRKAADGMTTKVDPAAERKKAAKARKAEKASLRAAFRESPATAAKLFLETKHATISAPESENCPRCLARRRAIAA